MAASLAGRLMATAAVALAIVLALLAPSRGPGVASDARTDADARPAPAVSAADTAGELSFQRRPRVGRARSGAATEDDDAAATPPAPPPPTVIEVTLRWSGDARPRPELLRLGEGTDAAETVGPRPRGGPGAAAAAGAGPGPHEVRRTFRIERPGRYAAAWHAWLPVPGTRTWRAARGQGATVTVRGAGERHRLTVDLAATDLRLDPALELRHPDATWHVTAKDG